MKITNIIVLIIFFISAGKVYSQPKSDRNLLLSSKHDSIQPLKRSVSFGITENKNILIKYNPLVLFAGGMMFFYQSVISSQLSATCGFNPSCSEMGKNLIKKYGILKGTFCTSDRLMRCNKVSFQNITADEFDKNDGRIHESAEYYK